jgi:hypothetical protein
MKRPGILTLTLYVILTAPSYAQRLGKFSSVTGRMERNGSIVEAAYPDQANYFGYILPDSAWTKPSKSYLFFRLNSDVTELGIRILSPVPELVSPDKGDLASEKYLANEKKKSTGFTPKFRLNRQNTPLQDSPGSVLNTPGWKLISKNDTLQAAREGSSRQAVVRLYDEKNKNDKTIQAGLYMIEITPSDTTFRYGSFLVQIGTTSEIKSVILSEKPQSFEK